MRNNLQAALDLISWNWAIFPLHSPTPDGCDCRKQCDSPAKHPRTRNGFKDATTDPAKVTEWLTMWPVANLGIATGEVSGIVAVDVDPRHEGDTAWVALCSEHDYQHAGPISSTGGGGWHYLFKHPGQPIRNSSAEIGPGIDVRGDGGYIVAPPSVHASGTSYEWCDRMAPDEVAGLPDIPPWLLTLMTRKRPSGAAAVAGDEMIPEGQRHGRLVSLAGGLRDKNLSERVIFKALAEYNLERCNPPMDVADIARIAASAGTWEMGSATITRDRSTRASVAAPAAYTPQPFPISDLEHEVIPEPRWALPGILPEGLAILAGRPKIGKSWWSLGVAIAIASGGVAMGEITCAGGDVLMLALEDNRRRLKSRMKMLIPDGQPWPVRLFVEIRWPAIDEGGLDVLDAWLGTHPEARLVVTDTHARMKGRIDPRAKRGDIYREDYQDGVELKSLADRHNVCLLVITHYNKGMQEDWINSIQGSAGVSAAADTLLGLARQRGEQGQKAAVLHLTGRDVSEEDYGVAFDGGTGRWTLEGDAEEAMMSRETAAVAAIIREHNRPMTPAEIAPLMQPKKSRDAVKMICYRAATRNLFTSTDGYYAVTGGNDVTGRYHVTGTSPETDSESNITPIRGPKPVTTPVTPGNREPRQPVTPVTGNAGNAGNANSPVFACHACGQVAWWQRASGDWVCSFCHPEPGPRLPYREDG